MIYRTTVIDTSTVNLKLEALRQRIRYFVFVSCSFRDSEVQTEEKNSSESWPIALAPIRSFGVGRGRLLSQARISTGIKY